MKTGIFKTVIAQYAQVPELSYKGKKEYKGKSSLSGSKKPIPRKTFSSLPDKLIVGQSPLTQAWILPPLSVICHIGPGEVITKQFN